MMAKNSAKGMLTPTMMALRRLPRNSHWIHEHEQAAEHQVMQHGVGRDAHKTGAIVKGHHFHAGRQRAVVVDVVNHALDSRHHIISVVGAPHDNDRFGHVIIVVLADDP